MPLDQQLLPNPALKPYYDKVVWLFVTRNFKNDDRDLEALRTHDRFGVSSWPQMIVFDARDDHVLLDAPRDLRGFTRALDRAVQQHAAAGGNAIDATAERAARALAAAQEQRTKGDTAAALAALRPLAEHHDAAGVWLEARRLAREWAGAATAPPRERLADPDPRERALALEALASEAAAPTAGDTIADPTARAEQLLLQQDEDIVVRTRALRLLAKLRPQLVVQHATALLALPNDPFRYEVLEVLAQHPEPKLGALLAKMFTAAGTDVPSRNPNVLRMGAAACLAESRDASAVDAVAPLARAAEWRNGTTTVVVKLLGRLAERLPAERPRIAAVLLESFPPAAEDAKVDTRPSLALAGTVLAALAQAQPGLARPQLPAA